MAENKQQKPGFWDYATPILTGMGAAAVTGAYNNYAVNKQNQFNAEEAERNRQYETQMSNTAYQRAYADMAAAGLNPNLAGGQGGASTPAGTAATGAQAMPLDINGAINAAANTALTRAQKDNIEANTELAEKQSGKTEEERRMLNFDRKFKEKTQDIQIALMSGDLSLKQYKMMVDDATTRLLEEQIGIEAAHRKTEENNRRWHEIRDSITAFIPFAPGAKFKSGNTNISVDSN